MKRHTSLAGPSIGARKFQALEAAHNRFSRRWKSGAVACAITLLLLGTAQAATIVWNVATSGGAWVNNANWTGGAQPGSADVAQFGSNPTANPGQVGINHGTSNRLVIAAIEATSSRTINLNVMDSSATSGTNELRGATVNSVANTILRNAGTLGLNYGMTNSGAGSSTLRIGVSNGVIDATSPINIGSVLIDSNRYGFTKIGADMLTLTNANRLNGDIIISAGRFRLAGGGTVASVSNIIIGGGATFDVAAKSAALTLASGQALVLSGTNTAATLALTTSRGLTLASDGGLKFTAYNGSTPPLTVTGAASLTVASGNSATVTVANGGTRLAAGSYKLVAIGAGNSTAVAGTAPSSVTVNGDGIQGTASLSISGGELYLVGTCPSITLTASLPDGTDGVAYNQSVTASGGSGSYTYTVTSGTIPSGLTLSSGGVLSGTPDTVNTYNFTVTATDTVTYCTGSQAYSVTIAAAGGGPTAPAVTTPSATAIGATTGTLGGTIANTNNASVTDWGVYWSTSSGFGAPAGTKVNATGNRGDGAFTVAATGLPDGTVIYFQAFASNSAGAGYSTESSFMTAPLAPVMSAATAVTNTAFDANWSAASSATNYLLDAATDSGFSSPVSGYNSRLAGNVTTFSVTGLSPNVTYYFRARAQNAGGISTNPSALTAATPASTATVSTTSISGITPTTADGGGNVTADGGASVTARGVCWNTGGSPTTADACTTNGSGTGTFTSSLTGLTPGETYYVRAYAVNSAGTSYGGEVNFAADCFSSVVTGLHADPTNTTDFTANWNALAGSTGYRIDVSASAALDGSYGATSTVFRETMGSVGANTAISTHESGNGFDNDSYTMSDGGAANAADVRTSSNSSGYTTPDGSGASGNANVFFTSTSGDRGFAIAGIDSSGYTDMHLSFGYRKEDSANNTTWSVQWSTNGGSAWNSITVSNLPSSGAAQGWYLVSNLLLPDTARGSSLSLRWVKSGTVAGRIDDVTLQGTPLTPPSYLAGYTNRAVAGVSVSVTGLSQGVAYYYRVRAEGAAGCTSDNSATATVTTASVTPQASFTTTSATTDEGAGTATITIQLTSSADATVQVARASASTATDGSDFTFATTNIVFTAGGSQSSNVVINLLDDTDVENTETAIVQIVGGANVIPVAPTNYVLSITDNEPTVQFTASSASVGESSVSYTVTVYKSSTANGVTGQVALSGSALLGTDYSVDATNFTLQGGTTSATFTVSITNDASVENTETVVLTLANLVQASAGSPSAFTLNVTNDDCVVANAIAFQGFEGDSCDTWTITNGAGQISSSNPGTDNPASSRIRNGSQSWQVVGQTASTVSNLDLAPITISGYNSVTLQVHFASLSVGGSGNGADNGDLLQVFVSLNNAAYSTPDFTLNGNGNARWGMSATGIVDVVAGSPVSNQSFAGGSGTFVSNSATVNITIPDGYATMRVRVLAVNNSSSEAWSVDDVSLVGNVGGVSDTNGPVFSSFNISGITTNDAGLAAGFNVTGTVVDTLSGLASDGTTPYLFIQDPNGAVIEASNTFDTAPTHGTLQPAYVSEAIAGVAPASLVLGVYTATLGAVDVAGSPNTTTTNFSFTVTDDDSTAPILSSWTLNGTNFLTGTFPDGILITGKVLDVSSGVYAITNLSGNAPRLNLYSPSGVQLLTNAVFTNGPNRDGTASTASGGISNLGYTAAAALFLEEGVYTAVVSVTDYDLDRTGDELTTTTNLAFSVAAATVRFDASSASVGEAGIATNIALVLSSTADATVRVALAGSATEGVGNDYTNSTTNVVFTAGGALTQFVTVVVNDDATYEGNETVILSISGADGAGIGTPSSHTLTIVDNDCYPHIAFQGFESDACDTWSITNGAANVSSSVGTTAGETPYSGRILNGANSWQVNNSAGGTSLDLAPVDISGHHAITVTVRLASISLNGNGNGIDNGDQLRVFVSLNNAPFGTADAVVNGNGNAKWGYDAFSLLSTVAGTPLTSNAVSGVTTSDNRNVSTITVVLPDGYSTARLRITGINDSANELWAVDDVSIDGVVGAVADTNGPVFSAFALHTSTTNDAGLAAGFSVTGLVQDAASGVASNAFSPYYFILNSVGGIAVASNTFAVAPTNGGAQTPSRLADTFSGVAAANISLGVYTVTVGAADTAGSPNSTTTNYTFTVTDDDSAAPVLSGFVLGGQSFALGTFSDISITGRVQDSGSGVHSITNLDTLAPRINLFRPSGVQALTNAIFTDGPNRDGSATAASNLAYSAAAALFPEVGTYTALVSATDFDVDRTGDESATTTSLVFYVTDPTVQFLAAAIPASEGLAFTNISISISGTRDATVQVAIAGTATPGIGNDYTNSTTNIVFTGGGSTVETFSVYFNDDATYEGNETIVLGLANVAGATLGSIATTTVTIIDNECLPGTIAFQGFESDSCDTWAITSGAAQVSTSTGTADTPANSRIRNGLNSWQANNGTYTLDLSNITVSSHNSVTVSVRVASTGTSGGGNDGSDNLKLFVSLNNAPYSGTADITINGNSDAKWDYNATNIVRTTAGTPASVNAVAGHSTNAYALAHITIPDGYATVRLRITALNNAATEFWSVDDIAMTGNPGGVSDTNGPVFTGFAIHGSTTNDAGLAAGLTVTGLVQDALSGIASNADTPYILLYNNLGVAVVASNGFDTAPAQGGALLPSRLAETVAGLAPGDISIGVYTVTVGAVDAAGLPNATTTNYTFTVADDDSTAPVLSGFTLGGQSFPLGTFAGGIAITGRVQDAGAGVYSITNADTLAPRINLYSPSGVQLLTNAVFTNGPNRDSTAQTASNLAYTASASIFTEIGIYTAVVAATDTDNDRTADGLTTATNLAFTIAFPTVQFLANTASIPENGGGSTSIAITVSASCDATVQVAIAGTALGGTDYTNSTTNIVFATGGFTTSSITLYPLDDFDDEGTETIELELTNANGLLIIGATATNVVTLGDNDGPSSIWFQGFEGTVADTWGITAGNGQISTTAGTSDTPASQRIRTGTKSWQVINSSNVLDLADVSLLGYNSVTVTVHLSSTSGTGGNGADALDVVRLFVALNGGAFGGTPDITVSGPAASNARWAYNASGLASTTAGSPISVQPAGSGNRTTDGYATLAVTIPDGSTSVKLRLSVNNNSSDERWNVDDVTITGVAGTSDAGVHMLASPSPAEAAINMSYLITVSNVGPDVLASATVTNALDATLTYVSSSSGGSHSAGKVTWTVAGLGVGNTTNLTVTVKPTTLGAVTSRVTILAGGNDGVSANNEYTVTTLVVCASTLKPIIAPLAHQTVVEATLLSFQVSASDPGCTNPSLSASGLPSGASFGPASNVGTNTVGTFTWTPGLSETGTYPVRFTASDGSLSSSIVIRIYVAGTGESLDGSGVPVSQTNWHVTITNIAIPSSGNITVTWASVDGITYDVYQSDNNMGGSMTWTKVVAETNASGSFEDASVSASVSQRYFQVVPAGGSPISNGVWAVIRPTVNASTFTLVSPGTAGDRAFDGALGSNLAQVLSGDNGGVGDNVGDEVFILEANQSWRNLYLDGSGVWRESGGGVSTFELAEGQGFQVLRNSGSAAQPRFTGPVGNLGTSTNVITDNSGNGGWNLITFSQGKHIPISSAFGSLAEGSPEANWDETQADLILVLNSNGSWRRIMRAGDGTWFDLSTFATATIQFGPGTAVFYYRQPVGTMRVRF